MKKLLSILLAIVLVMSVSVTAFAATPITKEEAQEIALKDAGYSASEVIRIKSEYEFDDGREVWNVDFIVEENGLYKDYDYEILASDGRIIEKDWDYEDDYYPVKLTPEFINQLEVYFAKLIEWLRSLIA